jgi:hypothetical protein
VLPRVSPLAGDPEFIEDSADSEFHEPSLRFPFSDRSEIVELRMITAKKHDQVPMSEWNLAQINVGRLVAPRGDPRVAPFFDALDRVNALADSSAGFIWRLQSEAGNATDMQPTSDPLFVVNMSLWSDAESLFDFVYRSAHTPVMARRRDYFERFEGNYLALWWVPAGHTPDVDEGLSRLWRLDRYGPTRDAFTFKMRFPAPGLAGLPKDMQPDPWCLGRA